MEFEVKFKSIAVRWFINVLLIVICLAVLGTVLFSAFLSSVYIDRVKSLGNDYAHDFSVLDGTDEENFGDFAVSVSDSFTFKDKIEVQVIDKSGKVFVSTNGFLGSDDEMPDLKLLVKNNSKKEYFKGKNSNKEPVLACSTAVFDAQGNYVGAYRWVTSLLEINKRLTVIILIIIAFALLLLGICVLSGVFFINSIVRPIRDVSNAARKIAMGDFETKIEPNRQDEIGELCDTINYMASELSHAETIKNDFISSVSHELRTPLTAIRGWGETAKMSLGTDEELVGRGLDVVLSEADRLSGLVEELLDFSRMQSGRLTVNMRPIDISALLREATDMYKELARKQGIDVSYTAPAADSMVMGDPDRLKQVFINVIDNAVKYTEKGGLVLVVQTAEEGCVKITVKDTGVGIPAQDIDRVKEKFFKSNKTVRGSGIGLAVADEIMKQHNGLLFLESTEGVGTTVTIVLPILEETDGEENEKNEEVILTDEEIDVVDEQIELAAETDEPSEIPFSDEEGETQS